MTSRSRAFLYTLWIIFATIGMAAWVEGKSLIHLFFANIALALIIIYPVIKLGEFLRSEDKDK